MNCLDQNDLTQKYQIPTSIKVVGTDFFKKIPQNSKEGTWKDGMRAIF